MVERQRYSAACLKGFAGLRRPYPNGLIIILHTPAIHTCLLCTANGKNKILHHCTLSRTIPVLPVCHPHGTHTASHGIVSLKHPLRACAELGIDTSRQPEVHNQSRYIYLPPPVPVPPLPPPPSPLPLDQNQAPTSFKTPPSPHRLFDLQEDSFI